VGIFWAKVRPISASEFLRNIGGAPLQTWAERAVEFTIRYRNGLGLTQRHRIRMGQRIFNIVGFVNRDELNVNLVITTAEVLA
jgi:head-tail adaptor